MVQWLNQRISLNVHFAEDREPVLPGAVILAPPGYHLMLERDSTLSLSQDEPIFHSRPSLDVLFESVVDACGSDSFCIVLTGASCDGAAGAEAIRQAGGRVYVQNPDTAEVPVMPRAALGKSDKNYSMELDDLANKLLELANE